MHLLGLDFIQRIMTDGYMDKHEPDSDFELNGKQLRQDLGLPNLRSETNGPPADTDLLNRLVGKQDLSPSEIEYLHDCLDRYEDWRREYNRIIDRRYHEQQPNRNELDLS